MWHMADGWGWWMLVGWIWMVAFWGVIVWAALTIARQFSAGNRPLDEPSALAILERRYASGEISHEEFEERRRRLLGK